MSLAIDLVALYDLDEVDGERTADVATLRAAEDATLVTLAKGGDGAAFEELVRRYRNDVFGLSYHYVRNREDAWDLSQEVFIKAYRGLGRFRQDASFRTWLLRITVNRCKDFFRKRRLKTVTLDGDEPHREPAGPSADPGSALAAQEVGEAITAALETLPEKHRTAFVLREFEGLSYEGMAEVMGCTLGTVMSRLHHARKKMQRALIQMGAVEES